MFFRHFQIFPTFFTFQYLVTPPFCFAEARMTKMQRCKVQIAKAEKMKIF